MLRFSMVRTPCISGRGVLRANAEMRKVHKMLKYVCWRLPYIIHDAADEINLG